MSAKSWYRVENRTAEETSIYIYDEISAYGVKASDFVKDLSGVTAKTINLFINSPGGNVFDGVTIYNSLKRHSAKVNVSIDGLAASIASVIAMAGDTVDIAKNAMIMVHRAWSYQVGNTNDMQQMAGLLSKIDSGTIITSYAEKTGLDAVTLEKLMDDTTWMTAQEAKDFGFVDSIGGETDAKGCFKLLAKYDNAPQNVLDRFASAHDKSQASERELEHLLRDAGGMPIAMAKAVVAFVKNTTLRDADDAEDEDVKKMRNYRELEGCKTILTSHQ